VDVHRIYGFFASKFRPRRMKKFGHLFPLTVDTTVLDVGGTCETWRMIPVRPRVTLLNILNYERQDGLSFVKGDACALPFASNSFEVAFSNSVIEHLTTWERQQEFAKEITRVGRTYFVQTPNYWFPFEPHFLTPLFQFLPKKWRKLLAPRFTVRALVEKQTKEGTDRMVEEIRLLTCKDLKLLFPRGRILRERFMGFTKSFMVISGKSTSPTDGRT
jgi:hypothetical protein